MSSITEAVELGRQLSYHPFVSCHFIPSLLLALIPPFLHPSRSHFPLIPPLALCAPSLQPSSFPSFLPLPTSLWSAAGGFTGSQALFPSSLDSYLHLHLESFSQNVLNCCVKSRKIYLLYVLLSIWLEPLLFKDLVYIPVFFAESSVKGIVNPKGYSHLGLYCRSLWDLCQPMSLDDGHPWNLQSQRQWYGWVSSNGPFKRHRRHNKACSFCGRPGP